MRTLFTTVAIAALGVSLSACGDAPVAKKAEAEPPAAAAAAQTTPVASAACPDNGPRLKHTGLCQAQAAQFLGASKFTTEGMPEGCDWVPNDASFGDGSEAILYMAARCKGRVTQLEVRGGAQSASIGHVVSGLFEGEVPADQEVARVFTVEAGTDGKGRILDLARQNAEDKKEAAGCEVRDGKADGYPDGSLVVDISAAYRKANKIPPTAEGDQPDSRCGPFGFSGDSTRYWRVHGGYAWLFELGQDMPDFDAASMLLMRKDASGAWVVVK